MTKEEKAKAYDSALEQAKKELAVSSQDSDSARQIFRFFPQLRENEDEKVRKALIDGVSQIRCKGDITREQMIAYLEKQKAMTAEEHEIVKVNINGIHGLFPPVGDGQYIDETAGTLQAGEKQKEPHYTKRNALLDKCVENCDPKTVEEVNKRVGDIMNIPELSPFEQALTNFIGDWENDEEHWPSQFAKKHGKRIFDIAREEVQKEQKHPNGCFTCDEYKKGYEEGRRNGVTAGYNKAMKEVEQKEQKPIVTHGEAYRVDTLGTQQVIAGKMPQKPAEWSEEDDERVEQLIYDTEHIRAEYEERKKELGESFNNDLIKDCDEQIAWLKALPERFNLQPKQEWSEEDEKTLNAIIDMVGNSLYEPLRPRAVILSWLNSLRPSWKPSDEQMNGLAHAINLDVYDAKRYKLDSLYNDLKKLM